MQMAHSNVIKIIAIFLIISANCCAQLAEEYFQIKRQFSLGKINAEIANNRYISLQKKYGENPTTIEIYNWRALTFFNQGNTNEVIKLFNIGLNKANKINNDTLQFKFLSDLASVYRYRGEYDFAFQNFQKLKKLLSSKPTLNNQIPEYIFSFQKNFGQYYQEMGDFETSINYFKIAREIAKIKHLDTSMSWVLGNMATSYFAINKLDLAKECLLESLKYPANFEQIADKYLKLAEINFLRKEWPEMDANLKLANTSFFQSNTVKAGSVFPSIETELFASKGKYLNGKKRFAEAEEQFIKAIAIGKRYTQSKIPDRNIVKSYKNIAQVQNAQKNHTLALQNLQKAFEYNSYNFSPRNISENAKLESIKNKNDAIEIYKEKIIALLAIYRKERKNAYLFDAISTINAVHELINYQRNSFQMEGSKLFLSEQAHEIYGLSITAAYEMYVLSKQPKYLDLAFKYSEANKAIVLGEAIKASETTSFLNVPEAIILEEKLAIKNLAIFESRLIADSKNETIWRKTLIDETQKLNKIKDNLKVKYPEYYNYKYASEPITLQKVQGQLNVNQAVIEYFIADSSLYIFQITKSKTMLLKQNLTVDLSEKITQLKKYYNALAINKDYQKLSNQLFYLLFPKSLRLSLNENNIDIIKIVPDGTLNFLPFESLLIRLPSSLKEPNIYMIEKYCISYLPSATWILPKPNTQLSFNDWLKSFNKERYQGFAPNYRKPFELPQNKANVIALADEFNGIKYLDVSANLSNFKEAAKVNNRFLHLSMHGSASINDPMKSYLTFGNDTLFAHDIYASNIPSKLSILDACDTGAGALAAGEGIMSLARAFLYSGSNAVAMGLWKLASVPETGNLIKDFLIDANDSQTLDKALQMAKLKYLEQNRKNLQIGHPFYWAPIVLVGDTSAIEPSYLKYWLFLLVCLVVYAYNSWRKL
jgi:CHAT domain-containing protein/tetratricopeptide (TPR) repeat protein